MVHEDFRLRSWMIAVSYQTPGADGIFDHCPRHSQITWPTLTGHIFKTQMIAVSFWFEGGTMMPARARVAAGFFPDPEMIAQS
jgi:hypothetical protein